MQIEKKFLIPQLAAFAIAAGIATFANTTPLVYAFSGVVIANVGFTVGLIWALKGRTSAK